MVDPAVEEEGFTDQQPAERAEQRKFLASMPSWCADFLQPLVADYGVKLLLALMVCQHLVKGFVNTLNVTGIEFLLKEYNTTGPDMQVYKAFILLPWGMKPLMGLLSDVVPIGGYRKLPYMLLSTIAGVCGLVFIGYSRIPQVVLIGVVVSLFLVTLAISFNDLLSEAKYAERLRHCPENGPSLMTFVWGGIVVGGLVATLMVGTVIERLGVQYVYVLALVPMCFVFVILGLNYIGDEKLDEAGTAAAQERVKSQPEILVLTLILAGSMVAIGYVTLSGMSKKVNAAVAVVIGITVILAFLIFTKPLIGRMNAFTVLQTFLAISMDGATFYFFTNGKEQWGAKQGPEFSIWFYTTGIGVLVAIANLVGLWSYNKWMRTWNYRSIFWFSNIMVSIVHLWGILIYSRWNLKLGIPDHAFAISTAAMSAITFQWMWMPCILLLGQCCPKGVEATMYALLAGCHNLGNSGASMLGAYVLESFGIAPAGHEDEGDMFDNLWKVALIACVLPTLTMLMIPVCIPNAPQTERLLGDDHLSATDGSPWQRWTKRAPRDEEQQPLTGRE